MLYRINKKFSMMMLGLMLILIACSPRQSEQDIQPVGSIEPQAIPEKTLTAKPTTTPTKIPRKSIEPVSPVSPISPAIRAGELAMPVISDTVELIPGSEQAIAAAVADLSEKTGLPADEIRLISIESVEWSDTSLGCPQEGFMYAQVITPGYLIVLEAQGQQYEYHTNQTDQVILCEQ